MLSLVYIDSATRTAHSDLLFKSLKQRRKVQSISNMSDFLTDFSPVVQPREVIFSPLARWIFASIESTINRSALMKSSLLFQPVALDDVMKHDYSRPASANDKKTREIPPKKVRSFSEEIEAVAVSFGRQKAISKISGVSLLSCSSPNSGSSCCSTSSTNCFRVSAFIHCIWKNKVPYFIFSVDDDRGNIYAATQLKVKSSSCKGLDYVYLFHSWSREGSKSKKHVDGKLNLVGRMTVASSAFLDSDRSKVMETEFVLFAPNEEHPLKTHKTFSDATKANGCSIKAADFFKPIHSYKRNDKQKLGESASIEDMQHLFAGEPSMFSDTQLVNYLVDDFSYNYELAAVVVKDYGYHTITQSSFGGWGLKFLEKGQVKNADSCQDLTSSSKKSKEYSKKNRRNSARDVNVIVPAGFHGGPVAGSGGPSSLTKRWKSNGKCDCGGWDVGCPVKVLKNDPEFSNVSPLLEPEEECKSLELFVEGARQAEPSLKLLNLKEDLHAVYFQPTLSALQSFSIVVANIHSQMQHIFPDM